MPSRVNTNIPDFNDPRLPKRNRTNHRYRQQSMTTTAGFGTNNVMTSHVRPVSRSNVPESGKAVTALATSDLFTSAVHGYTAGDRVRFSGLTGGAGITAGQDYYVIASGITANDFRVSATAGGTTIDVTTDLTAGTVTRQQYTFLYAGDPGMTNNPLPPVPGPRRLGNVNSV